MPIIATIINMTTRAVRTPKIIPRIFDGRAGGIRGGAGGGVGSADRLGGTSAIGGGGPAWALEGGTVVTGALSTGASAEATDGGETSGGGTAALVSGLCPAEDELMGGISTMALA